MAERTDSLEGQEGGQAGHTGGHSRGWGRGLFLSSLQSCRLSGNHNLAKGGLWDDEKGEVRLALSTMGDLRD